MVSPTVAALLSVAGVSLISFLGALTLSFQALRRHTALLGLVAFAAGTLIGDAFIHLLPEAVEGRDGFPPELAMWILAGFVFFFLLEGVLRWGHAHGEDEHPHVDPHKPAGGKIAPFAWTNLVGDGIHNFVDGVLIGASYLADVKLGIATTIAVAAHEIPQELGDFAVLVRAGIKPRIALGYNFLSAVLAVIGAVVVLYAPIPAETIEFYAIPIIAGGFLYIAAADLVPELHHHTEGKYIPIVLLGFTAGLAAMALLLKLEGIGG